MASYREYAMSSSEDSEDFTPERMPSSEDSDSSFKGTCYEEKVQHQHAKRLARASKPWTAARCQRLLRPLRSGLASLSWRAALPNRTMSKAAKRAWDEIKDKVEEDLRNLSPSEQGNLSPSRHWLKQKKKVRRTYKLKRPTQQRDEQSASTTKDSKGQGTAKGRRRNEKSRVPGELVVATPLLRRARGHVVPSPASSRNRPAQKSGKPGAGRKDPGSKAAKKKYMDKVSARLKSLGATDEWGDFSALMGHAETFLKATKGNTNTEQRRGPRSLLDMCLRKMPQYIEELEAQERMDAVENGTVSTLDRLDSSTHVYNYLEGFAPTEALGWRHLRAVVRADGIKELKNGILEGLIEEDDARMLVDICLENKAFLGAEELIVALIDRQYSQPGALDSFSVDKPFLGCLSALRNYAYVHDRSPFLLRQYTRLVSGGILPLDWLRTGEFECIWKDFATRCLSKAEAAEDAVAFTSCSVSLLCRQKLSPPSQSELALKEENDFQHIQTMANVMERLTSVLTVLASMSWVGEIELCSESVSEVKVAKIRYIGDRLRRILSSCVADLESSTPTSTSTGCNLGMDLLRMALFLSSSSARDDADIRSRIKNSIEQAWRQNTDQNSTKNDRSRHRLSDIASLVASVARSGGRGMSLAPHNCLDTIFVQLECLELDPRILASMKAVTAFSLAQQTKNVQDFVYAEKLASSQSSTAGGDARSGPLFTGYRWEETIGEWVTASPVVKKRQPQTRAGKRGSTSGSEVDHGKDSAKGVPTQPEGSTDGDADSVPGLEIERQQTLGASQASSAPRPRHVNDKKRSHSSPGDDKPRAVVGVATSRTDRDAASQPTKSADPSLDDELGSDMGDQDGPAAKKPRRSTDRTAKRSSKPRSSLASQGSGSRIGDDDSEDELCM
ncbi:hypothetical protein F4820DRAFT_235071 [Hypoxylon rubiginosum]|uniref:Uncharacterized protein n=1 Tax=Hypoxylon rubiginosum TaxID=110542 RepID=A0ACB9Z6N5_9PEZI|nr:hypothetical protein F4820DRAFT_235071 [Hypoxylon rubiginosum]